MVYFSRRPRCAWIFSSRTKSVRTDATSSPRCGISDSRIVPRRPDAALRCDTRVGSIPMMRALVASTAARLRPITITPAWREDPHDRPVPFHSHDTIHDGEMRLHRGIDIEYARIDPFPMENVLGPSVVYSRHHSEEVLHGKGHASPMVRFHLCQGHHTIRLHEGSRQGKGGKARPAPKVFRRVPRLVIQVHERNTIFHKHIPQTGFLQHEDRIPGMAGALRHQDLGGPERKERLRRAADHVRMRVDVTRPHVRLDQVRLEKNPFPMDLPPCQPQFPETLPEDRCDVRLVRGDFCDQRFGTPIPFRAIPKHERVP